MNLLVFDDWYAEGLHRVHIVPCAAYWVASALRITSTAEQGVGTERGIGTGSKWITGQCSWLSTGRSRQ